MQLSKNTLNVGLEKPLKVLHVTDTHIGRADERDNERKHALAKRLGSSEREQYFHEQLDYAEENCDLLVHTGDLIDFTSQANFDFARTILSREKVFFAAGNHEFSQYVGEAYEDRAYKMNSFREMMPGLGAPLFFNARILGGINFVSIDDSYHQFEDWQITRLKKEIAKGLPIILCLHAPLFEQSLYDYHVSRSGEGTSSYLVGCDEEHLLSYSEFRAVQQRPDGATMRMIDLIKSEPLIKGILTGHLHFNFESMLTDTLPQLVTDCSGAGLAREVTLL